jgi:hypothetical protein
MTTYNVFRKWRKCAQNFKKNSRVKRKYKLR